MYVPPGPFPPTVVAVTHDHGVMLSDRRCNSCLERYLHKVQYADDPRDYFLACLRCDGPSKR